MVTYYVDKDYGDETVLVSETAHQGFYLVIWEKHQRFVTQHELDLILAPLKKAHVAATVSATTLTYMCAVGIDFSATMSVRTFTSFTVNATCVTKVGNVYKVDNKPVEFVEFVKVLNRHKYWNMLYQSA